MRSRSRDVVVSDCGLSEIASKGKVFVASFVEYDHMFKEYKCETEDKQTKQITMEMRRCKKSIF